MTKFGQLCCGRAFCSVRSHKPLRSAKISERNAKVASRMRKNWRLHGRDKGELWTLPIFARVGVAQSSRRMLRWRGANLGHRNGERELGAYYGYPMCCVEAHAQSVGMVNRMVHLRKEQLRAMFVIAHAWIPCSSCSLAIVQTTGGKLSRRDECKLQRQVATNRALARLN